MSPILLDTHVWAWNLTDPTRLTEAAQHAIDHAPVVMVSPITFFEIALKVRTGKWPEMEPVVAQLTEVLQQQGGAIAALDPLLCSYAGTMAWTNRDPFDRLLAATALHHRLDFVSADAAFDAVLTRVW